MPADDRRRSVSGSAPRRARGAARGVTAVLSVAVLGTTGLAWSQLRAFEGGINHVSSPLLGGGEAARDGAVDILLVGMDSRTDAHGNPLSAQELATLRAGDDVSTNTDTIILVRVPQDGGSATAISIPRDSYVDAPNLGKMKINGVFGQVKAERMIDLVEGNGVDPAQADREATAAGREALIATVADLTGVTVDHYAEIGLLGFSLLTDALGGVEVCLRGPVDEPLSGANFPAGWQKLDGPQALSFVRQRHGLPRGDLDRVTRQQTVMASLAHQVISSETLSSPATLQRLRDAITRSVVLSDGWDIMDFVTQLQSLAAGNVAFATIPVLTESGWSDDGMQSVVRIDPQQVRDFVTGLRDGQAQGRTEELAWTPSATTVEVTNDTDVNGLAAAVSQVLTANGFAPGDVGNDEGAGVPATVVLAARADDVGARAVATDLGGLPVAAAADVPAGTVRVVLSDDYVGPGSGLDGSDTSRPLSETVAVPQAVPSAPAVLTAGGDDPQCVN